MRLEAAGRSQGRDRDLLASVAALVPGAECAVGVSASLIEPIALVARSPSLTAGMARRFLHGGVVEAHKASVYRSLVAGPLVEEGYSLLLACVFRERGLVAVVAYVRRSRDFTPAEIEALREALATLDVAIERHATAHTAEAAEQRVVPKLCVLGPDLAVDEVSSSALERERISAGGRLPPEIEGRVRAAIADWGSDIENCPVKVARTDDGRHVLRIFPLHGRTGLRIAVLWEPMRREAALLRSVERYGLTLREVQILNLLAGGSSSAEIAAGLGIAESTVNEHVVRMMQKTEATNRVELIATTMVNSER